MTSPLLHRIRWLLFLVATVVGGGLAEAAVTRQLCRFPDGERRVVRLEAGSGFQAFDNCEELPAVAGEADREPEPEPFAEAELRVSVIEMVASPAVRQIVAPAAALRSPAAASPGGVAPAEYQRLIASAARSHGIDPQIVEAVMYVESRFRPDARSVKGALGLMQLMPQTAQGRCGVSSARLFEPAVNIECGVRYLGELTTTFAGRLDLALAAYNAGPGAVMRHGWRVPPFAETQAYVDRVLQRMRSNR